MLRPSRRSSVRLLYLALLTALASCIARADADAATLERPDPRIVNGVLTSEYPSVGALLRGTNADTAGTWCSGTLIGCSTFLTAAHCVEGRTAGEFRVFLPHAGIFAVTSIAMHPTYDFPAGDVAVLKLGVAVDGVAPSPIESTAAPASGSLGVIVGYGRSGDPNFDYGLKRAGSVVTASCATIPPPASDATSVCWDFTNPVGAPGDDSNTCNADSGGPLFVDAGAGLRIAGVTSGGSSSSCLPADHSYDASVFAYHAFIQAQGGADLANTRCGNGPQVGQSGVTVLTRSGTLSAIDAQAAESFTVASGTTRLLVAMNAVDDGPSDFDLYVKAGSAPTPTVYDCGRFGPNQFAVCTFPAPATGPWHVLVTRFAGAGTYQLTITQYATACAAPGSDGTTCNDGNPCTTTDVCQSGACGGTPLANGTSCSDGNGCTGPDTCQAGACSSAVLPNGTACDDGDPCSRPDTCQAGACNGVAPALGCKTTITPGTALLALDNRAPNTRDRLAWLWKKGAATTPAELGNPTSSTPYTLCLYDNVGGVPQRRIRQTIPAGSRWRGFSRGFRYRDSTLSAGGLQSLVLTHGAPGKASIQVRGKGQALALPNLPLTKQPNVVVQLLNANACWTSTHSSAQNNDLARFKSKGD